MKRILVTGAGGSPGVTSPPSLRKAPEPFHLVGTDASEYYLHRAETDSRYLVPPVSDPQYLDVLNHLIEREGIEFVHAQNDTEVSFLSSNRAKVNATMLLPDPDTVRICQDKFASFRHWEAAGIKVPKTVIVRSRDDVERALSDFGGHAWLRAISGAGGRGSLPVADVETAVNWLDFQKG